MIVKEYSVPLYRQIAKCKLKSTEPVRSDLYLKSTQKEMLDINQSNFKTEIYNITKKLNSLIIYSNTTNLKITNKYFNGTPLYKVIKDIPLEISVEVIDVIKNKINDQLLIENENQLVTIYLNTDLKSIPENNQLKIEDVFTVGDSAINRFPNISIRKLKDRLKITINNLNNVDEYSVRLGSEYLFEPKVYNNWIEFYECVFPNLMQTHTQVYNHSFNIVRKTEYYTTKEYDTNNLKDPFLLNDIDLQETYFDKEILVNYNSYRSNLLIPTNYSEELFVYVDISGDPVNKTKNFHISTKEINLVNLIPILTKVKQNDTYEFILNPFTKTILRECNSEGYTVLLDVFKDEKYNKHDDIRISNSRVITTLDNILINEESYVCNTNGQEILQSSDLNSIPTRPIGSIAVSNETTLLTSLKNNILTYLQNESAFIDKYKIYSYKE